ncbi:biotin-protein ligase [Halteromyces radiatus]|uniref:biotin-protein ligase n=1 Tax=Halteromyces radiatus TaxID=101107 RepID=UPI00221F2C1F|nr:biotin-protein ligase [Halteromyces radiatus]KAI8089957.1 biotin-protein ligase [Halteromyces radiatus]
MNGDINQRVKNYVYGGGRYLGLCAGAYYASSDIAFEVGTPMEVKGPRELGFYPGQCRGTMYPGFVYNSNKGARAVHIHIGNQQQNTIAMFYNGGGFFVNPEQYPEVTVVATYSNNKDDDEKTTTTTAAAAAAVVMCKVGNGLALLSAVHPEYDVTTTPGLEEADNSEQLIAILKESRVSCLDFLRKQFSFLGLNVTPNNTISDMTATSLQLTPIYLCGMTRALTDTITSNLLELAKGRVIKDASNQFYLTPWSDNNNNDKNNKDDEDILLNDLNAKWEKLSVSNTTAALDNTNDTISLMIHHPSSTITEQEKAQYPSSTMTPFFDIGAYFSSLKQHRTKEWGGGNWYHFGNAMLYSEVITSTQTVLDKNYSFSQAFPSGRGRNSWVSQSGALQFSLEVRHSLQLSHAPVVFIQYIIALAVVESIRSRPGYEQVPLRLKWPNDIYADVPGQGLKKVGGLLVNSSFVSNEFLLIIGCGINLSNSQPTVSINDVISEHNPSLARLTPEDVLAGILVTFERFYNQFCEEGMGSWFLDIYYKRWLHSDKLVTLTTHDNVRARIIGITTDYGMLEVVNADNSNQRYVLQPDGNSFDMLKGLIIKKS